MTFDPLPLQASISMLSCQCKVTPRELPQSWEGLTVSLFSTAQCAFYICYLQHDRNMWTMCTALHWILDLFIYFYFFVPCSVYERCLNWEIFVLIQCEAKKTFNGTSPPTVTVQLPQMLPQPASTIIDRCHCPAEKVQSISSNKD